MKGKKIVLVIACLLIGASLYAGNFMLGASAMGSMNGNDSYGGVTFHTGYSFFEKPYLMVSMNVTLSPRFESAGMRISSAPFTMLEHPFDFAFANKTYWAPKLSFGGDYVMDRGCIWTLELSPFSFRDKNWAYEFLAPAMTFDMDFSTIGYAVTVMRFTRLF